MILDVGSGELPVGDINIDAFYFNNENRKRSKIQVRCSAEYLPFVDNSFDTVVCKRALHHVPNPKKAFAEFIRVSSGIVYNSEPCTFGRHGISPKPSIHSVKGFTKNFYRPFSRKARYMRLTYVPRFSPVLDTDIDCFFIKG